MTKPMKLPLLLATLALGHGTAHAAITVTNLGTSTPTGFATGNTTLDPHLTLAGAPEVFGLRSGNTYNQIFTLASSITVGKIYVGYGNLTGAATATTVSLTVDGGNNASNDLTESFTLTTSSVNQQSAAPYTGIHWLELDISSSSLVLAAGIHSFRLTATSVTGAASTWLLAPSYVGSVSTPQSYSGGALTGTAGTSPAKDGNFAIKAVPEPASLALLGLAALPFLRRRRP